MGTPRGSQQVKKLTIFIKVPQGNRRYFISRSVMKLGRRKKKERKKRKKGKEKKRRKRSVIFCLFDKKFPGRNKISVQNSYN